MDIFAIGVVGSSSAGKAIEAVDEIFGVVSFVVVFLKLFF